jgi:hypothetical protein
VADVAVLVEALLAIPTCERFTAVMAVDVYLSRPALEALPLLCTFLAGHSCLFYLHFTQIYI